MKKRIEIKGGRIEIHEIMFRISQFINYVMRIR